MISDRLRGLARPLLLGAAVLGGGTTAMRAQDVDCARLQQLIAQGGGSRANGGTLRRQAAEIARTETQIRQYGCGGFTFFGSNPQCSGLTERLRGLQAGMEQLRGGGGRGDLVARYNAQCRGEQPKPQRGFLESLFGGGDERREPLPQPPSDDAQEREDAGGGVYAHGGSQAVCVRTCDGGFFPMGISARHGKENLTEMCQALCPGTETAVYTRSPNADIKTAASLEGKPYTDLPNALKFEKTFTPSCSCRQPGKSWAETLANAEEVLGASRKGDIVVTKEKSDELSRPRFDAKAAAALLAKGQDTMGAPTKVPPAEASKLAGGAATNLPDAAGARTIRKVGPQD